MEMRKIGKSDLNAGIFSLGAFAIGGGSWWGENDDKVSTQVISKALDLGVNWIDTAPVYGFGHSEVIVGKAIKERRNHVIVSTKAGLQWYDEKGLQHFSRDGYNVYKDLSSQAITRDLEYSLKRLDTDYIDVYYTHGQSEIISIEETMNALMKMKKEGKIRAIGASNATLENLKEYVKYGQLDVIQEKYSLLDRKLEEEIIPFCEANNITVQAYSPIERGLLTGNIKPGHITTSGDARDNKKWWLIENQEFVAEMLKGWGDLTKKYNCTLVNLVIKWTVMQSEKMNVLIGARKRHHLEENLKAVNIDLEITDVKRMTKDADQVIKKSI